MKPSEAWGVPSRIVREALSAPEFDPRRGTAAPITINVRPQLAAFALAMEAKLQEREHYPYWGDHPDLALKYFIGEVAELREAVNWDKGFALIGNPDLAGEAIDVGNMAMMLYDNAAKEAGIEPMRA